MIQKFATYKIYQEKIITPTGDMYVPRYEWHGPDHLPIKLSPSDVSKFNIPLTMVRTTNPDPCGFYTIAVYIQRKEGLWRIYSWFIKRWLIHTDVFNRLVSMRVIMTLHIWGIGYVNPGEIPHWGCVSRNSKKY